MFIFSFTLFSALFLSGGGRRIGDRRMWDEKAGMGKNQRRVKHIDKARCCPVKALGSIPTAPADIATHIDTCTSVLKNNRFRNQTLPSFCFHSINAWRSCTARKTGLHFTHRRS